MFSLEMGAEELMGRMVSMESGVDWQRSRDGVASKEQNDSIKRAIKSAKKWPIQLCDDAFNLPLILSIARNWSRRYGVKAIVIDYCQLIRANSKLPREQQVAEISRECKLLAKSLKIPVILLAQINRESEKENREPRMSDLRESGALEQDADSITFLFQKDDDDKTGAMVRWVRPKQRGGQGYDIGQLGFIRQTGLMTDFTS
jgi:replicative DNA helicase